MRDKIQRILTALDGSAESEEAFAAMMPIVRAENPEVTVLHVLDAPAVSSNPPARLVDFVAALRADGVDAHLSLCEGKPTEEILRIAALRQPDLIVLETEGRDGLRRLREGSVAEAVLRRANAPVLLVRPGSARKSWSRMLVALDGSSRAEEILSEVIPLARRLGLALSLVQVAPPQITMTGVGDMPGVVFHEDPLPYLRQIQTRLKEEGVDAQIAAPEGRAAVTVLKQAAESGASLICLTTHGRTGLERVLLGSVAEEIVRHANCPVLIRRSVRVDGLLLNPSQGQAGV